MRRDDPMDVDEESAQGQSLSEAGADKSSSKPRRALSKMPTVNFKKGRKRSHDEVDDDDKSTEAVRYLLISWGLSFHSSSLLFSFIKTLKLILISKGRKL